MSNFGFGENFAKKMSEENNIKHSVDDVSVEIPTKNTEQEVDVQKHNDTKNQEHLKENQSDKSSEQEVISNEKNIQQLEINDDAVLQYMKSKGIEAETFEDLFKAKEVQVENPYVNLLDDEDKRYLDYKRETGRTRADFEKLNQDISKIDDLTLARERVRLESGLNLSNDEADSYLERKLGIDLSDTNDIDAVDKIELSSYSKTIRDKMSAEKEKYRQPVERKEQNIPSSNNSDYVTLEDGTMIKKTDYEQLKENHQNHIKGAKEAVNSVAESIFKISFDDNGESKTLDYVYEYSQEDKHSMLSAVSDVEGMIQKTYRTEKGFDHKNFNEDIFWLNRTNREKAIGSLLNKARAEAIAELMSSQNNIQYGRTGLPKQGNGIKSMPIEQLHQKPNYGFPSIFDKK